MLPEIEKRMPKEYNCYFEPFLGGGAVFFYLCPEKAVINDYNMQLMNLYVQIQMQTERLIERLREFETEYNALETMSDKDKYYYQQRELYNEYLRKNATDSKSAALLVFLNKAGFNGLYRMNKSGQYNVPPAHRGTLRLFEEDNIHAVANVLGKATVLCGDFEKACEKMQPGDFVFFDSPYYDTFDTYQAGGFSEEDHRRLFRLFLRSSENGVYCMMTNNNCDFIKNLYYQYHIDVVDVKRMINSDKNKRIGKEVIITNYEWRKSES